MATATMDGPMADQKPKTLSVKLHMDVIESARIIAAIRGVSMTDMLSDILRPSLMEMERAEIERRSAAVSPKTKGKRTDPK